MSHHYIWPEEARRSCSVPKTLAPHDTTMLLSARIGLTFSFYRVLLVKPAYTADICLHQGSALSIYRDLQCLAGSRLSVGCLVIALTCHCAGLGLTCTKDVQNIPRTFVFCGQILFKHDITGTSALKLRVASKGASRRCVLLCQLSP